MMSFYSQQSTEQGEHLPEADMDDGAHYDGGQQHEEEPRTK
jgi:hypothetical protein